jgi:hypothetical protein
MMEREGLIRRLDPEKLGPEIRKYVTTCRREGVFVTVIEGTVSKRITVLTHDRPEPRPELLKSLADAELFETNVGGAKQ